MFIEHNVNLYFVDTRRPAVLSFCWIPTVIDFKMCMDVPFQSYQMFHYYRPPPSFLIVSLITSYPKVLPQRIALLPPAGTLPALLNSCCIRSFSFRRPVESWLKQTRERYRWCGRGGGAKYSDINSFNLWETMTTIHNLLWAFANSWRSFQKRSKARQT